MFVSIVIMNFLIFATDPSVLNVFSELRKSIYSKLKRKSNSDFQATDFHEAIYKPKERNDGVTITEHTDFGTVYGETSSMDTAELKHYRTESEVVHDSPGVLEDGGSYTTAYSSLDDDDLMRRARAGRDVADFYDNI
ncbi:hypothetical protein LPJ64_001830 [Coemansia asiatica]|uniref:Uncharacterized protein n=1 Tax=Coemansia asiatica TaxID=1052880 RepID=A0A9W7XPU5_9FUNG|nr:hypothetical protein LPJ64_001830 [Coemansia asiatica]KAJ2877805.1 hypothetical protein FB639_003611 [Coemansia asiatica]